MTRWRAILVFAALFSALSSAASSATANSAELRRALNEVAAKSELTVGIAIEDLANGEQFVVNGDTVFPQGSGIRIHLLTELYRQAAAKKFALTDLHPVPDSARVGGYGILRYMGQGSPLNLSLRDYAVLVATVNDNTAANVLTDIVGMDAVNASLAAQGTPEIKFQRRAVSRSGAAATLPENLATPRAAMKALELLHRGAVVDRATSDAVIDLLALPDISYIRRELPLSVRFAGQSGSGPTFRCDQGIVLLPGRPYIVCVMVQGLREPRSPGPRDYARADLVIADVSRLALDYFQASARHPPAK